ncbi:MAG TPA: NHLP leader peptide family RiPP precursor [Chlamydiales bacterium]|nr:NHLP leader peptide family RiPP precursor [Chlamydiales bacterium]
MKENSKKWNQMVAKSWLDPKFKEKLLAHPEQTLKENGFALKAHTKYKIIESHKHEVCLVLPAKPEGNLSETELKNIAAASCASPSGCFGPP